jgi:hypothetical protein
MHRRKTLLQTFQLLSPWHVDAKLAGCAGLTGLGQACACDTAARSLSDEAVDVSW